VVRRIKDHCRTGTSCSYILRRHPGSERLSLQIDESWKNDGARQACQAGAKRNKKKKKNTKEHTRKTRIRRGSWPSSSYEKRLQGKKMRLEKLGEVSNKPLDKKKIEKGESIRGKIQKKSEQQTPVPSQGGGGKAPTDA